MIQLDTGGEPPVSNRGCDATSAKNTDGKLRHLSLIEVAMQPRQKNVQV